MTTYRIVIIVSDIQVKKLPMLSISQMTNISILKEGLASSNVVFFFTEKPCTNKFLSFPNSNTFVKTPKRKVGPDLLPANAY